MKRAARLRQMLWPCCALLFLLGGTSLIVLRFYLSSPSVVRQIAERLQEMLGGHVEIQSAQVGLIGSSHVHGIEVYEEGETDTPWLRLDDVTTDLSALRFLWGRSTQDLRLRGVHILLRIDGSGRLLTQLPAKKTTMPEEWPCVHIEEGELTLHLHQRPPMLIRGICAELAPSNDGLTLSGTVSDPFWNFWTINGHFNNKDGEGSISLNTENVAVTMTKLRSIPFVPLSVWREIHLEGTTPAQLCLKVQTKSGKPSVHYRLEVSPQDAYVCIPSISLEATQANGKAVVVDEIVLWNEVRGKTAGGLITTSGKLNFHEEPMRLTVQVGVQDVLLRDLPRSWNLPQALDGKLTGSANLAVTIRDSKVETAGSGEGVIRGASWNGFAINKPVRLVLHSEDGRFRFHQPGPAGRGTPMSGAANGDVSVPPDQANRDTSAPRGETQDDLFQNAPVEIVNLLGHGIQWAADGLSNGIDAAAKILSNLKPPSTPSEEPTYLDVDLRLQDIDLAQLMQRLKLNLPYAVAGRLTFQIHASIPINRAGDLKAYRLRGTVKLASFSVVGWEMVHVEAKLHYADGILNLEDLRGQMIDAQKHSSAECRSERSGRFTGSACIDVVPNGDLRASLKLDQVPFAAIGRPLFSLFQLQQESASLLQQGTLSGTIQMQAPLIKLRDPASWRGAAHLNIPKMELFKLPLDNLTVNLRVDEARAQLSTLQGNIEGATLTAQGEVQLHGAYPFKAEVHLDRGSLITLRQLEPAFRPPFELRGQTQLDGAVRGTLKPLQFDTHGQLHAHGLVVERFAVDDISFHWLKDKNDLKIDDIKANLYGGKVTGSARLPLRASAPGDAHLEISNLDVQAMAQALPAFPVRLEGKVSGKVQVALSPAQGNQPRTWTSEVEVKAPQLRVQGIPTEKLKGILRSRAGRTVYHFQGETLGGVFTIKGDLPAPAKGTEEKTPDPAEKPTPNVRKDRPPLSSPFQTCTFAAEEPSGKGSLELRNAQLAYLWPIYGMSGPLTQLDGRFSIFLNYRHVGPNMAPQGEGVFQIVNINWNDAFLGDSLQGNVRLTNRVFEFSNISGGVAGGLFLGQFIFGLEPHSRSWFHINLQQAEASHLLAVLPTVAPHVRGPVDVDFRGRIGRHWDGSGGVTLTRGQIYGLEITEWRLPLTFSFSPLQGSGELAVRDSQARLGQGRARFETTLNWGNGLRLFGLLLFYDVDLRTLLQNTPELRSYASGRISGRIDLAGNEMHSLNDLTALVQVKMKQGQALQLPVLRHLTPYLRPGASSATFQSGELKGRLAGGIFRMEQATLVGDFVKLLIQGTLNLTGNLDLDVTAQTGLYCLNPAQTNAVRTRIPLVGAIPRLVLYEANTLLAAAVVHLHVTGTVHAPVVRLEPLVTLTEDAVRFFLGRTIGLAIPNLP